MRTLIAVFACLLLTALSRMPQAQASRAIVLNESGWQPSKQFSAALKAGIAKAGFTVQECSAARLAPTLASETGPGAVLVLPDARRFPVNAKAELDGFLKRRNHLMAISGPAFRDMVAYSGGKWVTREQGKADLVNAPGEALIEITPDYVRNWKRFSGTPENKSEYSAQASGDPKLPLALRASISRLDDYDITVTPSIAEAFPEGATVTGFWAKGGPDTPEMVVEWREKDGARWMAVVKLTPKWKRYALSPADFTYWGDDPSLNRGGQDDHFTPKNADKLSFGLASGISNQKLGIAHVFWVSDIRAIRDPLAGIDFSQPSLESLSPTYKTYRTHAASLRVAATGKPLPANTEVVAPLPRALGLGFDAVRVRRHVPVLDILDDKGALRGSAAEILVHTTSDYSGSVWGYLGLEQAYIERNVPSSVAIITAMLKRMDRGVFLANAGVEHVAYSEGEKVTCGAYVSNLSSLPLDASVAFTVSGARANEQCVRPTALPPTVPKEPLRVAGDSFDLAPGEYTIKTVLSVGGGVVDTISYPFRVIKHKALAPTDAVSARDGDFYLADRKWYPIGVNYWPRYATGMDKSDQWGSWLNAEQYNPMLVEQDLELAQKLKMNVFSTQYLHTAESRSMMDFLERAQRHGVKVHAYMPGLDPTKPNLKMAGKLITEAHLAESPALFSYDLGWEVKVGTYDKRRAFDGAWQQWVIDRYGSVESAQTDWKFAPERVDGVITGPKDEQLTEDGAWRTFVAAYRRFWDDEISKRYADVRAEVRKLDPIHLMGARSGYGGTGSKFVVAQFPFDLASGAKHLDYISPEGYALSGDRLAFLRGGLCTEYGRFVSGGKPIFWAEYGMSIWPQCDKAKLAEQRDYYRKVLDMAYLSGASGSAGWWWPGGFRLGENSDYGLVNPDGTPRPAALEIQAFASKFDTPIHRQGAEEIVSIDRDKHVTGFEGIYSSLNEQYAKTTDSGRKVTLRTDGTGTTSANAPLLAVGNTPYSGANPPKYLNAEFNTLTVNGQPVTNGGVVEVERGKPVYVEASIGNLAEAEWLAPTSTEAGAVYLLAELSAGAKTLCPIERNTRFLADATVPKHVVVESIDAQVDCTFRMTARDRAMFGEVVRVMLRPK